MNKPLSTSIRGLAVLALLPLSACMVWDHSAQEDRAVKVEVPSLRSVTCVTHNGAIEIVPGAGGVVEGVATVTAWAETDERAKAELADLEVLQELSGGELRLSLNVPTGRHGDVSFKLSVPKGVELVLTSHNGGIDVGDVAGVLRAESHNGAIHFGDAKGRIEVVAHNGAITGRLGAGVVEGSITSHNGGIDLQLDRECSARVSATSHNGGLELIGATDASVREGSAEGTFGAGAGKLELDSHNGRVRVQVD